MNIYKFTQKWLFSGVKRGMNRRNVIESVVEYIKNDEHFGRNYLKGQVGDVVNAKLLLVGYNFRLILK